MSTKNTENLTARKNAWIITPAFNEAENIQQFLIDLHGSLGSVTDQYKFTLAVIDDGSRDHTRQKVIESRSLFDEQYFDVRCFSLIRNFGHQAALTCGLIEAQDHHADVVVTMDADGEHPPSIILKLLELWSQGIPIVHTVRNEATHLPYFKRVTSQLFYFLMRLGGLNIKPGMADFKAWDGILLKQVASFLPNCGSIRLFSVWVYSDGPLVSFDQVFREGRKSRFTLKKMASLATRGFFSYTDLPLRMSTLIGGCTLFFCLFFSIFSLVAFSIGKTLPGWTSVVILISFLSGVQIFSIGLIGEYLIQKVFRSNLPLFILNRKKR